ncbi:MAG: cell division protein ZipA [Gammaproteobacteria bacterium]
MSLRELIILLLGLAIVAVVLRGLYVAIQARRGQIRLAIDKNIPNDVDLEALELSELPSGGARVRARSAAAQVEDPALVRAKARASAMDLGDEQDEQIPVLMDAVDLHDAQQEEPDDSGSNVEQDELADSDDWGESDDSQFAPQTASPVIDPVSRAQDSDHLATGDEFADDFAVDSRHEPSISAHDFVDDEVLAEPVNTDIDALDDTEDSDNWEDADEESPDDVLFDYGDAEQDDNTAMQNVRADTSAGFHGVNSDDLDDDRDQEDADLGGGLSAIAPDYSGEDDDGAADPVSYADSDTTAQSDHDYEDDQAQDDWDESEDVYDDSEEDDEYLDADEQARSAPALGSTAAFEESLDEFSMSAGERIGGDRQAAKPARSSKLSKLDKAEQTQRADSAGDNEQPELFDAASDAKPAAPKRSLRASLFSAFSRRKNESEPESVNQEKPRQGRSGKASTGQAPPEKTSPKAEPRTEPQPQPLFAEEKPVLRPVESDTTARRRPEPELDDAAPELEVADERGRVSPAEPSEVLVMNVMAREGYAFNGHDLLESLITSGLKFGDMNIFHMRSGPDGKGPAIFSVANMLNPGTFDLNEMEDFATVGISLFLALPAPTNNLDALEKMLTCARQVQAELAGELRDDNRNVMTKQTIEHYRQRVRDFELRRLKAAGSRA